MDYLGLISLFALGPAMIMKPEYLWEVEHIFTVDGQQYEFDLRFE